MGKRVILLSATILLISIIAAQITNFSSITPNDILNSVIPDVNLNAFIFWRNWKSRLPESFFFNFSSFFSPNSIDVIKEITTGFGIFNLGTDVQKMRFKLRNIKSNYSEEILTPEEPLSFLKSSWDKTQKLIVIVHGYTEDGSGGVLSTTTMIRDAYQKAKRPENLIFVDWRYLARQADYFKSAKSTVKAGMRVAELLITLRNTRFLSNLDQVHLVGFSLGAHVCGIAAYYSNALIEGEQIGRITGLDPAGPGFRNADLIDRLDASDAKFVDVIHTNMGDRLLTFGMNIKTGHVDFYPNGGQHQPGCQLPIVGEIVGVCSHLRAPDYFSHSILGTRYIGCLCLDWITYKSGSCSCTEGEIMGEHANTSTRGDIYLTI